MAVLKTPGGGFMEPFQEKLNAIRKIIDDDAARHKVLWLCEQSEPKSFEEYSSSGSFRKLEKFESSTYSEVLRATNLADNQVVVMKIMRALSKGVFGRLPSEATKGCQSYCDILNEIVISQALSNLHKGVTIDGNMYRTHSYCQIHEIKVVSGNLEKILALEQEQQNKLLQQQQQQATNKDKNKQSSTLSTIANKDSSQLNEPANNHINQDEQQQLQQQEKLNRQKQDIPNISEDDRMLMEALPYEYVVSVMKHDGKPLWWMINHKRLSGDQLTSVLVQVIVGIAIAEAVYCYEHRDLHVSNILIRATSKAAIPFVFANSCYSIESFGVKATIIDATFSRLAYKKKTYYRDLTSTLRSYGSKKQPQRMSLQNRSYREMVYITKNDWESFKPRTNLIWLTYLCETLMKNDIIKSNKKLHEEIKKICDWTVKAQSTVELLKKFPQSNSSTKNVSTPRTAILKDTSNKNISKQ